MNGIEYTGEGIVLARAVLCYGSGLGLCFVE